MEYPATSIRLLNSTVSKPFTPKKQVSLPITQLRRDGGTQPRAEMNLVIVAEYAENMRDGSAFPPVTVFFDGTIYWLADGFHRVAAAETNGDKTIAADVRQGTQRDAILFSVGVNATHGIRRTNADKRRAVERLLRDEEWVKWSDREIARQCKVTHPFVAKIRVELSGNDYQMRTVSRSGTTYQQNTANIGKQPPPVVDFCKEHGVDTIPEIQAWETVATKNPKFFEEAKRGFIVGLDGEDVAVSDVDATLLRLAATEDEYERARRQAEYVRAKVELKEKKRREKEAAKNAIPADLPPVTERYHLHTGDFADVMQGLPEASFDAIITDPPYPREYLPLYPKLAEQAARVLKPGGSLLVMCGQSYLPEVLTMMAQYLRYQWIAAYLTPGGQSPQLWDRKVNTFWKPLLWFVNGDYTGDWIGDVLKSDRNDKRFHHWGQSEAGMGDIVNRFTYPGQKVLDPFVGGGTTAVVCVDMNRLFTGIDCDPQAIQTTLARLNEVHNGR